MNENEKKLIKIKNEMENVRELYVKGFISKNIYQNETRKLFEIATEYGVKEKDILRIKESIEKFNDFSSKEKDALSDAIELLWLNAGIQKKKRRI